MGWKCSQLLWLLHVQGNNLMGKSVQSYKYTTLENVAHEFIVEDSVIRHHENAFDRNHNFFHRFILQLERSLRTSEQRAQVQLQCAINHTKFSYSSSTCTNRKWSWSSFHLITFNGYCEFSSTLDNEILIYIGGRKKYIMPNFLNTCMYIRENLDR